MARFLSPWTGSVTPTRPPDDYGPGTRIAQWQPEDDAFWQRTGAKVARRNLG